MAHHMKGLTSNNGEFKTETLLTQNQQHRITLARNKKKPKFCSLTYYVYHHTTNVLCCYTIHNQHSKYSTMSIEFKKSCRIHV